MGRNSYQYEVLRYDPAKLRIYILKNNLKIYLIKNKDTPPHIGFCRPARPVPIRI